MESQSGSPSGARYIVPSMPALVSKLELRTRSGTRARPRSFSLSLAVAGASSPSWRMWSASAGYCAKMEVTRERRALERMGVAFEWCASAFLNIAVGVGEGGGERRKLCG
jgi:hypothetical protein